MFHYMDISVINDRLSYYAGSLRIQPAGLQDLLRYTGSWNPLPSGSVRYSEHR